MSAVFVKKSEAFDKQLGNKLLSFAVDPRGGERALEYLLHEYDHEIDVPYYNVRRVHINDKAFASIPQNTFYPNGIGWVMLVETDFSAWAIEFDDLVEKAEKALLTKDSEWMRDLCLNKVNKLAYLVDRFFRERIGYVPGHYKVTVYEKPAVKKRIRSYAYAGTREIYNVNYS